MLLSKVRQLCPRLAQTLYLQLQRAASRYHTLGQQLREFQESGKVFEARVRPQLDRLRLSAEALRDGHFFDRLKAKRLYSQLSKYEGQFDRLCLEIRGRAQRHETCVRSLLGRCEKRGAGRAGGREQSADDFSVLPRAGDRERGEEMVRDHAGNGKGDQSEG